MTSFRYLLTYCIICVTLKSVIAYEEACNLRNGEQGYCRNIHQCESAKEELKARLRPLICGYDGDTPIVCCSIVDYNFKDRIKFEEDVTKSKTDTLPHECIPLASQSSQNIIYNLPFKFPENNRVSSSKKRIIFEDSTTESDAKFEAAPSDAIKFEDSHSFVFEDSGHTLDKPIKFEEDGSLHYELNPIISTLQNADDKTDGNETATNTFINKNGHILMGNLSGRLPVSTTASSLNEGSKEDVRPIEAVPILLPSIENNTLSTTQRHIISEELSENPIKDELQNRTSIVDQTEEQYKGSSVGKIDNFDNESGRDETTNQADIECKRFVEYGLQFEPRTKYITGGVNADYFEFPHMAALGYENGNNMEWKCGGSLISDKFILTAAHCMKSKYGSIKIVRLGDIKTNEITSNSDVQIFQVSKTFIHPSYRKRSHYHDIAILQLDRPVNLSRAVIPACLQTNRDFQNVTLWATGWGALYFTGDNTNILQKVDLRLFSAEDCFNRAYGRQIRLANGVEDDIQICAGNPENGKDTCQGDSGGPLQIKMFNNKYIYKIVGITSFGKSCGVVPAVYTRVSSYMQWIQGIVWPQPIGS